MAQFDQAQYNIDDFFNVLSVVVNANTCHVLSIQLIVKTQHRFDPTQTIAIATVTATLTQSNTPVIIHRGSSSCSHVVGCVGCQGTARPGSSRLQR
jgi:hypothetical protein